MRSGCPATHVPSITPLLAGALAGPQSRAGTHNRPERGAAASWEGLSRLCRLGQSLAHRLSLGFPTSGTGEGIPTPAVAGCVS